jgi:MoxR-like ATPase
VFPSPQDLHERFERAKYIVDDTTITQVYVAGVLQKPILVEGPPGCGKTELAKALDRCGTRACHVLLPQ